MPAYSIYLTPAATDALVLRYKDEGNRSAAVSRMIERYAELAQRAMPDLTEAEWNLCRDALNGWFIDTAESIKFVPWEVADGIKLNGLDEKWKVDGPALVAKLEAMDFSALCALLDAVERWWVEQ